MGIRVPFTTGFPTMTAGLMVIQSLYMLFFWHRFFLHENASISGKLLVEIVIILTFSCYNADVTRDILPSDYHAFLQSIKTRVQQAQLKAVVAVNTELIVLYWQIGREILARQEKEGWGTGVIDRLAKDLHAAFPHMKGFSPRNLGYMKRFAQTYSDESILQNYPGGTISSYWKK
jgi:hypothetical protein